MKILFYFFVLLGFTPGISQGNADNVELIPRPGDFLYKATKGDSVAYVYGISHNGSQTWYPLEDSVYEAIKESSLVLIEGNPRPSMREMLNIGGFLGISDRDFTFALKKSPDTKNLSANSSSSRLCPTSSLNSDQLKVLAGKFDSFEAQIAGGVKDPKIDVNLFSKNKDQPIAIAQYIGIDDLHGIDRHVANYADDHHIPLAYFEDLSDQERALEKVVNETKLMNQNLSCSEVIAQYLNRVKQMDSGQIVMDATGEVYSDPESMTAQLERMEGYNPIFKAYIVDERNRLFVEKIEDYSQKYKIMFTVFGSLHLFGKNGILELLKTKGFVVERVH